MSVTKQSPKQNSLLVNGYTQQKRKRSRDLANNVCRETEKENLAASARRSRRNISFPKACGKRASQSVSANSVCRETKRQNLAASARHSRRSISFPSVCGDCRQGSESALLAHVLAAVLAHGNALLVKNHCPKKHTVNGRGEGKTNATKTVCNAATCVWRHAHRERSCNSSNLADGTAGYREFGKKAARSHKGILDDRGTLM